VEFWGPPLPFVAQLVVQVPFESYWRSQSCLSLFPLSSRGQDLRDDGFASPYGFFLLFVNFVIADFSFSFFDDVRRWLSLDPGPQRTPSDLFKAAFNCAFFFPFALYDLIIQLVVES